MEKDFFGVGDLVNVKALKHDYFKDFTGHIKDVGSTEILVEDEEGYQYWCKPDQLKHSSDDILHQYD